MPSPEEFGIESFLSRLSLVRVQNKVFGNKSGLSKQLLILPSNSQPVNIFISISFLFYEGSLMYQAFKYPWRMPCGSPCHVKVLNFTVAMMLFLNGLCSALGGNRLQRHANTKITDLGPCLKFMKRFQCPQVSLCHDHTIAVVYFTANCVRKRFYSCFFFSFFYNNRGLVFSPEILLYMKEKYARELNLLK